MADAGAPSAGTVAEAIPLIVSANRAAIKLREMMAALADPKLDVHAAYLQVYGPGGSSQLAKDIYYVLRGFHAAVECLPPEAA